MPAPAERRPDHRRLLGVATAFLAPTGVGLLVLVAYIILGHAYNLRSEVSLDSMGKLLRLGPNPKDEVAAPPGRDKPPAPGATDAKRGSDKAPDGDKKAAPAHVAATPSQAKAGEHAARILWFTSNLIMWFTIAALLLICVRILRRETRALGRGGWALTVLPACLGLSLWLYVGVGGSSGEKIRMIQDLESKSRQLASLDWMEWLDSIETLIVFSLSFYFAFANGALCARPAAAPPEIEDVKRRGREAGELLNIGAIFLVSGVFHIWAQWNWPVSLLASPGDREFARSLVLSLTLMSGALFTCVLGAIYFATKYQLRAQARELILKAIGRGGSPASLSAVDEALKLNGIELSLFSEFSSLAKVRSARSSPPGRSSSSCL